MAAPLIRYPPINMRSRRAHTVGSPHSPTAHAASRAVRASRVSKRYEWLSTRPLHILTFIVPFMVCYWVGSAMFLSQQGAIEAIKAERILGGFFVAFGAAGPYLSGLALLTVLVVWHIFVGDRWRVQPRVVGIMAIESALWALPLLLLIAMMPGGAGLVQPGPGVSATWTARLTISIGAGIYEELLFRMVLIAAVHFLLVDFVGLAGHKGNVIAVILAALAFAVYHDEVVVAGAIRWSPLATYFAAGVYLGVLYLWRGFGIAVGAHAVYDIVVLVFLQGEAAG